MRGGSSRSCRPVGMWSRGDSLLLRYVRYGKVPAGVRVKVPVTDGRPVRGQADRDWAMRDER